jgi:uncharacterized protein (DUF2236 family)
MREPLLIMGAARALLMQSAHPLIAQGALDHSDFASDPIGRFQRTAGWVTTVVFGTSDEAQAATRSVNQLHRRVSGELPKEHAVAAWAPGAAYRAQDRDLLLWVHASLIDSMLVTHRTVIGNLRPDVGDRYVREWDVIARLMGLPEGSTWESETGMRNWINRQIRQGIALPGEGSRRVARVILGPGITGPALAKVTNLVTAGMLPNRLRREFEIRWLGSAPDAKSAAGLAGLRLRNGAHERGTASERGAGGPAPVEAAPRLGAFGQIPGLNGWDTVLVAQDRDRGHLKQQVAAKVDRHAQVGNRKSSEHVTMAEEGVVAIRLGIELCQQTPTPVHHLVGRLPARTAIPPEVPVRSVALDLLTGDPFVLAVVELA